MNIISLFLQTEEVNRIDLCKLEKILEENNPLFEELK